MDGHIDSLKMEPMTCWWQGSDGVKDVENDYGSILDTGMRKGRIEVSGRTPIARELFRFDPVSFYIRGMLL
jgi:hypothetical protein